MIVEISLNRSEVKICVVGIGRMGYSHVRLLNKLGYLNSIVDSNPDLAENIGNKFRIPWYTNLETMAQNQSPNGIIIAVPTNIHSKMVQKSIKKIPGIKALLIEKPIASSVKEAKELKSILAEYNIDVIVGHIEVYNPIIPKIRSILKEGYLGDLRSILFQRRGAVGEKRIQTLGDVYEDIGVHDFDVASRLLPKNELNLYSSAVKVKGIVNSSVTIISSKRKEFYCTFLMSREYAGKVRTIDIEGTKATLHANLITQVLEIRSLDIARGEKEFSVIRIPYSNGEQIKIYGEPLLHEIWNLIDCIKGDSTPLVSLDDGICALKVVDAARRSIKIGKSVYFNL